MKTPTEQSAVHAVAIAAEGNVSVEASVVTTPEDSAAERRRLMQMLTHRRWLIRSLWSINAWEWLLPWPVEIAVFLVRGDRSLEWSDWKRSDGSVRGNRYVTFAFALWVGLALAGVDLSDVETYAGDVAKTLFTGALLLLSILSLSVGLPGQSIAKLMLIKRPSYSLEFVMPLVWGFLCGLLGALSMMFYGAAKSVAHPDLAMGVRATAILFAVFGALMEWNAVLQTVQQYLIGMVLWSRTLEDDAAKERAATQRAARGAFRRLNRKR
ncbi:MAG: hypothetical protein KF795_17885 [Labilithrix sp.]|nr:hypothetical protein [Labilithrix sp.]